VKEHVENNVFHDINGDDKENFYTWLEVGLFNQTLPILESAYEKIGGIRISQIRLAPYTVGELDDRKMELAEDQTFFFGKQYIFNQTNIKYDVTKLKNQSYIHQFTKNVRIEFMLYSSYLQAYIIVKINLNYFPGKIIKKQVFYVSTS
jgi:hypothetical protein